MKVTIQTLKNAKYSVDVTDDQTVLSVKQAINAAHQLGEPDEQKLIHKGKILKDDQTVGAAGVKDGDAIVIMVSKKKPTAVQPAQSATVPTLATPATQSTTTPATQSSATPTPSVSQPATTAPPADVSQAASSNLVIGAGQEAVVTDLMSMGFERDLVVRALRAAFGNPDRAAEYLFSGNIPAGEAPPAQTQAASPSQAAVQSTNASGSPAVQPATQAGGDQISAGLAGYLQSEQGQQLRDMIQQNPELLPALLQRMSQSDPQLFQALAANPQFLQQFLGGQASDPAAVLTTLGAMSRGAGGAAPSGAAGAGGPTRIQITQEEKSQLDQLEALGFSRQRALEAWLVCDRNVEMASSYLFSSMDDEQDFGGAGQGQGQGQGGAPGGGSTGS